MTTPLRDVYDEESRELLSLAAKLARERGYPSVSPEHLLLAMTTLKNTSAYWVVKEAVRDPEAIRRAADSYLKVVGLEIREAIAEDEALSQILALVRQIGGRPVRSEDLLNAMLRTGAGVFRRILEMHWLDENKIDRELALVRASRVSGDDISNADPARIDSMSRDLRAGATAARQKAAQALEGADTARANRYRLLEASFNRLLRQIGGHDESELAALTDDAELLAEVWSGPTTLPRLLRLIADPEHGLQEAIRLTDEIEHAVRLLTGSRAGREQATETILRRLDELREALAATATGASERVMGSH